jgi:carboxylesterase
MSTRDHSLRISGGRIGVLLLHGPGGAPADLRFVAKGLARTGHTIHCPQLAGHGATAEAIETTRWQDWYASAETALIELRRDCDAVVVGGLSTGAGLALLLAANHPDKVQGTVLFAPALWLNGWLAPWYTRLFRSVFSSRMASLIGFGSLHPNGIKDQRIREFMQQTAFGGDGSDAGKTRLPPAAGPEHRLLVAETRRVMGQIKQPTLIIHSREDDCADLNNAWYLQRNLKGMVDIVVLDDSYHMVTVDRQRHLVVERTIVFVDVLAKALRAAADKAAFAERCAASANVEI